MSTDKTYKFIGKEGFPPGTRALGRIILDAFAIMTATDQGWVQWDEADWEEVKTDPCDPHRIRYEKAAHAMQAGVKFSVGMPGVGDETMETLRVGINSTMVETSALVAILIDLGFLSREHWYRTLADGMEAEVAWYVTIIEQYTGKKVTLV